MPRPKTTGVYATREELVAEVLDMTKTHMPWPVIARRAGVSEGTVRLIFYHPEKR